MSGSSSRNIRSSLGSHDRKLRYKALMDELSTLDIDSTHNEEPMEKAANTVKEAQSLLAEGEVEERVKHPGEGFLNSRVLRASSDLALRCSEAVSSNVHAYDSHALAQHIKENPDYWDFSFPRAVPVFAFLFGTFAAEPKSARPRAQRERRERQTLGALQQPEDVEKLDSTEENSEMVSRARRFINKAYRNAGSMPLCYFSVVLDPTSFSRSVENIYYVSFLARDQLIELAIDEEKGLPTITPLPSTAREGEGRDAEEKQLMVSIDMQRWQDMVQALHITEPFMKLKRI